MARVATSQTSWARGYNTKDEPITLREDQGMSLVNAYPAIGSPRPREGIDYYATVAWPAEAQYVIHYSDDVVQDVLIGFLSDTSGWIKRAGSNICEQIWAPGAVSAFQPSVANLSHQRVEDSIFMFSSKRDWNIVLERTSASAPFFSWRSAFVFNFNSANPDPTLRTQKWQVRPQSPVIGFDSSLTTADELTENATWDGFIQRREDQFMYARYLITYVRRDDENGFSDYPTNSSPQQTSVFSDGVLESDAILEENSRIIALRKDPANIRTIGTDIKVIDRTNANTNSILAGEYMTDEEQKNFWRCVQNTFAQEDKSEDAEFFVPYFVSDFVGDANGRPNIEVEIPRKLDEAPFLPGFELDAQITHIRIYRTLFFPTIDEAKGASLRFLVDLPKNQHTIAAYYLDTTTDAALSGEDNLFSFIGTNPPPLGSMSLYRNGTIWIGGVSGLSGRFFRSTIPLNTISVKKYVTHFDLVTSWVDVNHDTGDTTYGIGETADHVIFLMKNSIQGLFRGDLNTAPIVLSRTKGAVGSRCFSQVDGTIYYLSQEGPARIVGNTVELIADHTAGELWPIRGSNTKLPIGKRNFFELPDSDKATLRSIYANDSWFLAYNYQVPTGTGILAAPYSNKDAVIIGFYESPAGDGLGPFQVETVDPQLMFVKDFVSTGSDSAIFHVELPPGYAESLRSMNFLRNGVSTDLSKRFTIRCRSRRLYADPQDRTKNGHLWDLMMYTRYDDSFEMAVSVILDINNVIASSSYSEPVINGQDTTGASIVLNRNNIQYAFPEGAYGNFFEVEWSKVYDGDFSMYGFDLRYHIVRGAIPKFLTTNSTVLRQISPTGVVGTMQVQGTCDPLTPRP